MTGVVDVENQELTLTKLGLLAREEIACYQKLRSNARKSAFKATLAIFRAGKWLTQAHDRLKAEGRGKWTTFQDEHDLPRTTVWEAVELYRQAKTEEAVSGLTPTHAKRKFDIVKPKKTLKGGVKSLDSVKTKAATVMIDPRLAPAKGNALAIASRNPGDPVPPKLWKSDSPSGTQATMPVSPPAEETEVCIGWATTDVPQPATPKLSKGEEPPLPDRQHPLLTTLVQIVHRLELLIESDLPAYDPKAEPATDIQREIARGIELLRNIERGIAA